MEESDPRHLLVRIAKILEGLKIPYLVTGGIAVLLWGRPRFTADIESILKISGDKIDRTYIAEWAAKLSAGKTWEDFSQNRT